MDFLKTIGLWWYFYSIMEALVIRESVVFDKISTIHTSRSFWKLTLVEDLESHKPKLELANKQLMVAFAVFQSLQEQVRRSGKQRWIQSYDELLIDFKDLKREFDELRHEYNEIQKLENSGKVPRIKRSILPFIGHLTSILFGTVSEDELESVKRNLEQLSNNQETLTHVLNESLSLVNTSRNEIGENRKKLNEAIGTINQLNRDLKRIQANSNTRVLELEHIVRIHLQSLTVLNRIKSNVAAMFRQFRVLQIHFNMLSLGRLSPVVVKPNTLLYILKEIRNNLAPPLMLVKKPETNLWYYYRTLQASTVIHEQKLIVIIDIPLVNTNSRLELFQIHNLPFPGKREFQNSIAQYELTAKGIALNYGRTEYMLLNEPEFSLCSSNTDLFCKLNNVRFMIGAKMHCESSLFMADSISIKQNCEIQVSYDVLLPTAVYINKGRWAISTKETFPMSVSCDSQTGQVMTVKSPLTLFQLNETCLASSSYFTIPAQHIFRSNMKLKPHLPHMAEINIKNASYWEALEKTAITKPIKGVLKKLGAFKSVPITRLLTEISRIKNPVQNQKNGPWQLVVIAMLVVITCIVIVVLIWCRWKGIPTRNNGEQNFEIRIEAKEGKPEVTLRGDEVVN